MSRRVRSLTGTVWPAAGEGRHLYVPLCSVACDDLVMSRHRLQIVWTVEVEDEDALREHVREETRTRLEPHGLAGTVADATSKDVTSSLMDIAQTRLFGAGIPGVGAMQLSSSPVE